MCLLPYPTFAVGVLIYNLVMAFGSFLSSFFATPDHATVLPEKGIDASQYSLMIESHQIDPLERFPGIKLSEKSCTILVHFHLTHHKKWPQIPKKEGL